MYYTRVNDIKKTKINILNSYLDILSKLNDSSSSSRKDELLSSNDINNIIKNKYYEMRKRLTHFSQKDL